MDYNFQFRDKIRVAVSGAETPSGKRLIGLLNAHRWFKLIAEEDRCDLLFSTLPNTPQAKVAVITTCPDAEACIVLPEINGAILSKTPPVVRLTHPDGIASALALALKPLDMAFGVAQVHVVALLPIEDRSVPSLDVLDSAVPVADVLSKRLRNELIHLLGKEASGGPGLHVDAQAIRIALTAGLMLQVSVKLLAPATAEEVINSWREFRSVGTDDELPSKPAIPLHYFAEPGFPQLRLHRSLGGGSVVSLGALEPGSLYDYQFVTVSDPEIRGSIGGAVLNAELLVKRGLIYW